MNTESFRRVAFRSNSKEIGSSSKAFFVALLSAQFLALTSSRQNELLGFFFFYLTVAVGRDRSGDDFAALLAQLGADGGERRRPRPRTAAVAVLRRRRALFRNRLALDEHRTVAARRPQSARHAERHRRRRRRRRRRRVPLGRTAATAAAAAAAAVAGHDSVLVVDGGQQQLLLQTRILHVGSVLLEDRPTPRCQSWSHAQTHRHTIKPSSKLASVPKLISGAGCFGRGRRFITGGAQQKKTHMPLLSSLRPRSKTLNLDTVFW